MHAMEHVTGPQRGAKRGGVTPQKIPCETRGLVDGGWGGWLRLIGRLVGA